MRINKRGITMVEIIVSIALISVVLIFLMSMFLKVRGTYYQSKIQADYDMLVANITKAIGNDIDNYGLLSVEYETPGQKDALILTFKSFRPSLLSERVTKVLRITFRNRYYISYSYEEGYTSNITTNERISNVVRELPVDAIVDNSDYIELKTQSLGTDKVIEIKIPIADEQGNIYDINIYGLIKPE